MRGRVVEGYWNDLGTPARYLEATFDVLSGRVPLARFPGADPFAGMREVAPGVLAAGSARLDPSARIVGPSLVGEDAMIGAGAVIGPRAVVGAAAQVPAGAVVREAILWEDTALAPGEELVRAIAAGTDRVSGEGS